jgi:hypothetical protein
MPLLAILAHQNGWDEILMVVGPVAVFAALLGIARRRALEQAGRLEGADEPDPG